MRGAGTSTLQIYKGNLKYAQELIDGIKSALKTEMDAVPPAAMITRHVAFQYWVSAIRSEVLASNALQCSFIINDVPA